MQVELTKVIENKNIAHNIFKITLQGDIVKNMNQAGQFVNIRINNSNEYLLRRPISICEINKEQNTFVMIYRAEGAGTKIISQMKKGDVVDILGPLGNGYDISSLKKGQTALLVGGGIGVPPLYELAKKFRAAGINTIHILGFNNQGDVFYEEEFKKLGNTYVATADGSYGEKGFVTDLIKKYNLQYDKYYSCGPLQMLNALKNLNPDKEGYISLEERMACGVGACYACVCKTEFDDTARVCYDGPVFKAEQVIF
ncbi:MULTISPECIES: dihydroorotate dehydrogenase electron transfer subunit [unclassified Gemella]|uniref:dihydroorotate dehydrogenase electron transfer subunit n=1 Tax=unclassified Gemella TaxID=2624949 RepID=UPI001C05566A|nr:MULTISPECIES: dihydroorotate dehydrogenase electron transfer subunit [unclassified Gemella]MBU0278435.1 dihydroorotate dehydrogenase electron transfer subunit [Gemella sp. zg-1178]QWQ38953.1 dihydroorotate dehydrogenase electron transfer subunit [Gemella sp. zg-570]